DATVRCALREAAWPRREFAAEFLKPHPNRKAQGFHSLALLFLRESKRFGFWRYRFSFLVIFMLGVSSDQSA
ncbi:MAG TPA: hypothetical protein VM717_06730, partial [Chthoniobacterales bacterium]|nr:hypothetical protein [Chthoniobacterales bacterium]